MARDYIFDIQDPADPSNPGTQTVKCTIPADLYTTWYTNYSVKYENLRAAHEVLTRPDRIFRGTRHLNYGFYCYVGQPTTLCIKDGIWADFPASGFVYSAYLNDRMILYEIRQEKADPGDPLSPIDYKNRYGALIWPPGTS